MATSEFHEPLKEWFSNQNIRCDFDFDALNSKGFWDEAALLMGRNFDLITPILNQMYYCYRDNRFNVC